MAAVRDPNNASPASKIAAICALHEEAFLREAAAFRRDHLIPFCKRNKASFIAGNGAWTLFLNVDTPYGFDLADPRVARAARIPASEVRSILATLEMSLVPFGYRLTGPSRVSGASNLAGTFGYEVEDYDSR